MIASAALRGDMMTSRACNHSSKGGAEDLCRYVTPASVSRVGSRTEARRFALRSRTMGSKFRHVHARSTVAKVTRALRELALARGYREAEAGAPADHDVIVAADKGSKGWASIYSPIPIWDAAISLSSALRTRVLVTSIFDSDVLDARLYNDGAEVDIFCSDRDGAAIDRAAREVAGQPRRWDSLCVGNFGWRDVKRLFTRARGEGLDPEAALVELGALVGLHERSLYPDNIDPNAPGVQRLRFMQPPPVSRQPIAGRPVLRALGSRLGNEIAHDQQTIRLHLAAGPGEYDAMVESIGGASGALEVAIRGGALDTKLVTLARSVSAQGVTAELTTRTEGSARWFVATLGGVPAASAPVWKDYGPFLTMEGVEPKIALQLGLTPLRAGTGELRLRWTPREPDGTPYVQNGYAAG